MKKIICALLISFSALLAIELGQVPTSVELSGENGGKLDGTAWHSSSLTGKVSTVFYVDPDEKDLNDAFAQALKHSTIDKKKTSSVVIINLAATWLPNVLIESKLKEKQKRFPNAMYIKDKTKVLVKKWNLEDDNYNILIFDKEGKLIYKKFGKMSEDEIKKAIVLIKEHL